MLAMDVVDTLRHRRLLVKRELNSAERDQQLLGRLREIYRSQGIDVSDEVLRAGVEALREERFTYRPPHSTLAVRLARIYVQRGKWGLRSVIALLVVLLVWVGYAFFVTGPAAKRLQGQVDALNTEIGTTADRLRLLVQESTRIAGSLDGYAVDVPAAYRDVASAQLTAARSALAQSDSLAASALKLNQPADLVSADFTQRSQQVGTRLQQQQMLVSQLDERLKQTRGLLADIDSLKIFPDQLAQLKVAVLNGAREKAASRLANEYFENGMSALRGGLISDAERALAELRNLNSQLMQSYTLQVVSRPGEQSGVWRVPERNPDARNYYLIVEAVSGEGKPLTMTISNEEDGSRLQTQQWGLRVNERTFRRVAADKGDDGIIQGRRVGEKRRGYLNPEYLIETSGDTITRW